MHSCRINNTELYRILGVNRNRELGLGEARTQSLSLVILDFFHRNAKLVKLVCIEILHRDEPYLHLFVEAGSRELGFDLPASRAKT